MNEQRDDSSAGNALISLLHSQIVPQRWYFGTGVVARLLQQIPTYAPAFILGVALDAIYSEQPFVLPFIPPSWIPATEMDQLVFTVCLLAGLSLLEIGLGFIGDYAWHVFAQRSQHRIRRDTYAALQQQPMRYFDTTPTGETMSVLNNDVNNLEEFLTRGIDEALTVVEYVFGVSLFMFLLSPSLTVIVLGVAPLLTAINYRYSQRIESIQEAVRSSVGTLNARLENNITRITVIKTSATEPEELDRVEANSRDYYQANLKEVFINSRYYPVIQIAAGYSLLITILIGGYWLLSDTSTVLGAEMPVGTLIPFIFYTRELVYPVQNIYTIVQKYQVATASARRIVALHPTDNDTTPQTSECALESVQGSISCECVSFSYRDGTERLLDQIAFSVDQGAFIGIVGPSGAGKSTILKLLIRFYEPDSGTIRLDGTPIREIPIDALRDQIGYVSQEPYIFPGSVLENIRYGSNVSEAAVVKAAKTACAHKFIRRMDQGYHTAVGEDGVRLSGGQRQRIALARVILKDSPVVLLDEALSHVDTKTEARLRERLHEFTADRTTFAIAHRLSTIQHADQILVVEGGEIVECGTHDELISGDGVYNRLWRIQTGAITQSSTGHQ